jgi:hypothetical protein
MHPPDLDVRDGKNFDWPVTIVEGQSAMIVLQPVGYEGQTLFLTGDAPMGAPLYKHEPDKDGNIIYKDPIIFEKAPATNAGAGTSPSTGG